MADNKPTPTPEMQKLLAQLNVHRAQFNTMRSQGRTRIKGQYGKYANELLKENAPLIRLGHQFTASKAAVQQSFDRIFIGNKRAPGLNPTGNYRVMEHEDGELILIDMNHADAWKAWEKCLIQKAMPTAQDIAPVARELDQMARAMETSDNQ